MSVHPNPSRRISAIGLMCPRNMCGHFRDGEPAHEWDDIFGFVLRSVKECGDSMAFDGPSAHQMGAVTATGRGNGAAGGCGVGATNHADPPDCSHVRPPRHSFERLSTDESGETDFLFDRTWRDRRIQGSLAQRNPMSSARVSGLAK